MSNVWLVMEMRADDRFDTEDASRYGQVCPVFPRGLGPYDTGRMVKLINEDVFPASSELDYICNAGPSIMVATLAATWVARFGWARMLVWDRKRRRYNVVPLRPDPYNDSLGRLETVIP